MWDLIVSVPDHCLSFYFVLNNLFNDVACNDICTVFHDSQQFLQKAHSVQRGWHCVVSYICYIAIIESD